MNKVVIGLILAAAAIIIGIIVGKSFHDDVLDCDDDDEEDFDNFFGNNEGDIDVDIYDVAEEDDLDMETLTSD